MIDTSLPAVEIEPEDFVDDAEFGVLMLVNAEVHSKIKPQLKSLEKGKKRAR